MHIKLLQLNIFKGKFYQEVIELVKKENYDIVQFQEVTGGRKSNGGVYAYPEKLALSPGHANIKTIGVDLFTNIKNDLGMNGELVKVHGVKNDKESYEGNATFFKKNIRCLDTKIIWMKEYMDIDEGFTDWTSISRAALSLHLQIDGRELYVINAHMAWGPTSSDTDYKINQAKKLADYIATLQKPFVLTGDFNVTPETKTASMFNALGRNLITENNVSNTLNFNVHPAKHLLPHGISVDYIFTEKSLRVNDFHLISSPDLSDHMGLKVEFEIED